MDEEWISKKELLEQFHISYGALYRYKRMGLIPEAWFLRRATVTGQETYFRRAQILPRMELILSRGASLESLAAELRAPAAQTDGRVLVVRQDDGIHRFPVEEIRELYLARGDRQVSLLDYLKEAAL